MLKRLHAPRQPEDHSKVAIIVRIAVHVLYGHLSSRVLIVGEYLPSKAWTHAFVEMSMGGSFFPKKLRSAREF